MINLIMFETPAGSPIYLNPESVQSLANFPNSNGQAIVEVVMPSGSVKVKGTLESVARMIAMPELEQFAQKKGKTR
jgi:hypothetical protein